MQPRAGLEKSICRNSSPLAQRLPAVMRSVDRDRLQNRSVAPTPIWTSLIQARCGRVASP
jgi:hypothetical protein